MQLRTERLRGLVRKATARPSTTDMRLYASGGGHLLAALCLRRPRHLAQLLLLALLALKILGLPPPALLVLAAALLPCGRLLALSSRAFLFAAFVHRLAVRPELCIVCPEGIDARAVELVRLALRLLDTSGDHLLQRPEISAFRAGWQRLFHGAVAAHACLGTRCACLGGASGAATARLVLVEIAVTVSAASSRRGLAPPSEGRPPRDVVTAREVLMALRRWSHYRGPVAVARWLRGRRHLCPCHRPTGPTAGRLRHGCPVAIAGRLRGQRRFRP
mmetsp:Transcript_113707/g.321547  ORF Transcript_113707/g.321547 Transcript_113707/m.321547 type:complete len:275 (+) Transcript_113707:191-1015(+)